MINDTSEAIEEFKKVHSCFELSCMLAVLKYSTEVPERVFHLGSRTTRKYSTPIRHLDGPIRED